MKQVSINRVIQDFNSLMMEDKEFALNIITKMLVDARRDFLLKQSRAAINEYQKGKSKNGTVNDMYKDLEND